MIVYWDRKNAGEIPMDYGGAGMVEDGED